MLIFARLRQYFFLNNTEKVRFFDVAESIAGFGYLAGSGAVIVWVVWTM